MTLPVRARLVRAVSAFLVLACLAVPAAGAAAAPDPPVGMISTAGATQPVGPLFASALAVEPIRLTTAKSLRESDFAPIIETSLFTSNDYSAYAWIHFRTGSSSATLRIRWRWYRPDGTYFDGDSPWWSFGSEGQAAGWIELRTAGTQTGRWQVKYYAQQTVNGSWQYFGESIFFIDPGLPCTQLITNGDFESGSTGWLKSSNTYIGTAKPHWGAQSARLGAGNSATYYLYRDVTLPAAAPGELAWAFYDNVLTDENGYAAYDRMKLQIRDTAGYVLETLDTISNLNYYASHDLDVWQPLTWDLSRYAGRTIRLWIEAQTDSSLPTTWYLDDFSVSQCPASVSYGLRVILAEPSDTRHDNKHNRAYYENLFRSVRSYHIENTMGRVTLNLTETYDNGGSWYKLSKTHKEYAKNPLSFVREAEQAALGTTTIPADTIVVVVHAGAAAESRIFDRGNFIWSKTWEPPDSPNGNELVVSEDSAVGTWAHEIGHDLGSLLVGSCTPDLYKMGNVKHWDLMASGNQNGGWLCKWPGYCDGSNPPHMSSYTKEFLQLLQYQRVDQGQSGSYWIDVLPRQQLGDSALQYVVTRRDDGTPDQYYVVETRNSSSKYSQWDTSVPDSGLVIYWVDTKGKAKYGTYSNNIDQTINQVAVLKVPGLFRTSEYFDADNLIRFKVVEQRAQGTSYALKLDISTPAPDPSWLAGVILRPDGKVASDIAPAQPIAAPPWYPQFQPDLDLHVYTDDGRHVGMNYVSGEYENQVDGAVVSGNLLNAHEWILLPQGTGFHYVVRSTATQAYLREHPEMTPYTDGSDAYEVLGLVSVPYAGFFPGTAQRATITSGANLEHGVSTVGGGSSIQVGAAVPRILPVDVTVTASGPALASPGEVIRYSLTFGNSGGTAATGIDLRVRQPEHTELVSAPGFVFLGNQEYGYQVSGMDIAAATELSFAVRVPAGLPPGTPLQLAASIQDDGAHGADGVPGNNQCTVTSLVATRVYLPVLPKGD